MKKADTTLMKQINMNTVRQALKRLETTTKPQLAAETGLSVVTIAALVRELEQEGEIREEQLGVSTGGRPATIYRFNYEYRLALSIHLHEQNGIDTLFAAVVNLRGEVLKQEERPFDTWNQTSLLNWIDQWISVYPQIHIVGLGIPGQVVDGEIVVSSHNELRGTSPATWIQERFGLQVLIENDVNAALHGYLLQENKPERISNEIVLGLYFPKKYPPGMAISINGTLIGGKRGMAGEVKYLPLDIDWTQPPIGEEWQEVLCRIIHTASVILAPERIVLYDEVTEQESLMNNWQSFLQRYPLPAEPNIHKSERFSEHFATGLHDLALQAIEPRIFE
ncbi:ROK family transcriptional regulator [Saccharibacillus sp. JS10]|uniref:ROK family transcriptional regulator n=1 Tax=Saccharibacillus sp. JS10 TaxID=2950552 RepID=UPI00210F0BF0|nr:ROK family protein [Saccharibacillus sp. JS10]MCQ4085420.1 ROK family protein [Saccharibacillus sp. JS10]